MDPAGFPRQFRPDINALRALAVASVVLYHFNCPGFGGGFVGVDIFFVVSGYLMAGIIVSGTVAGNFSLLDFYAARARRIIPALAVLCTSLIGAGYWFLLPSDYRLLGKHTVATLGFSSNIVYQGESGYFDAVAQDKWLLHTWSLSVEWQFYVLFPLLIIGLWRVHQRRAGLVTGVALAAFFSFLLAYFLSSRSPADAFYGFPARAWEMLAGALAAMTTSRRPHLGFLGTFLLGASLCLADSTRPWPGLFTLLPVCATVAILQGDFRSNTLVNLTLVQALGTWSYSIYLWHWPLVVALHYFNLLNEAPWRLAGALAAVVVGGASYRLIEVPGRRILAPLAPRWQVAGYGSAVLMLFCASLAVYRMVDTRPIFQEALIADAEKRNINPRMAECMSDKLGSFKDCVYGEGPIRAIVIGDSHAAAIVTAVAAAARANGGAVLFWGASGCPLVTGMHRRHQRYQNCDAFKGRVLEQLANQYRSVPVILANRWSFYAFGYNANEHQQVGSVAVFDAHESRQQFLEHFAKALVGTVCQIRHTGRSVYLLAPIPELSIDAPSYIARTAMLTKRRQDILLPLEQYHRRNGFVLGTLALASQECGARILDPTEVLCDDQACKGSHLGRPLYFDDDHLSEYGNTFLISLFQSALQQEAVTK